MSRNVFKTRTRAGLNVEVVAGWDRPTSRYFCTVMPLDDLPEEGELDDAAENELFHFSQMGSEAPENAQQIVQALAVKGVVLPQAMVTAIESDGAAQAGNVVRVFNEDGLVEQFG